MKLRLLTIAVALLASIYALVPTFLPSVPAPWGAPDPIPLGIDLQGGIRLVLEPELEDAVISEIMRDAGWLRRAARKDRMDIESVRWTRPYDLEIVSDESPRSVVLFVDDWHGGYRYRGSVEGVHRFELPWAQRRVIEERVFDGSVAVLQQRVGETCNPEARLERYGSRYVAVTLPGLDDVQQAICH